MPLGGAGLRATPARPRPRSSNSSTISPPYEWPTRTGGWELADQGRVMIYDLGQPEPSQLVGALAELLHVAVLAGPFGSVDGEAPCAEVGGEVLRAPSR
jgi:hypothetical protein